MLESRWAVLYSCCWLSNGQSFFGGNLKRCIKHLENVHTLDCGNSILRNLFFARKYMYEDTDIQGDSLQFLIVV